MILTREGSRLGLAILLVGLASLNTGNNLMYLILSVMLSVFFLSLLITSLNLKGIKISIEPLEELFAQRPSRIKIRYSKKGYLSSLSLFLLSSPSSPVKVFDYIKSLKPNKDIEKIVTITPLRRGLLNLGESLLLRRDFPLYLQKHLYALAQRRTSSSIHPLEMWRPL